MSLDQFFTSSTAIVLSNVAPKDKPSELTKIISYMPQYEPDLQSSIYHPSSNTLPYQELFIGPQDNPEKHYKASITDKPTFGKLPLSTASNDEKQNPFESEFSNGVRLQFVILPEVEFAKVGDVVGVAQIWAASGNTALTADTQSLTFPIYRIAHNIQFFKNATDVISYPQYVATLGAKPYFKE